MKIIKYCWTILVFAGVLSSGLLYAVDMDGNNERTLRKPLVRSALNFDGNRIDNDLENNGMIVSQNVSGRSGMTWPAGNGTQTIYASGIWLGGKVNNQVRVVAGEFNGEYASGPWGADHNDIVTTNYNVS